MKISLSGRWMWWLGFVSLLTACSSDDFSPVGSGLPLDVGQEADSVSVPLDPPLLATSAQTVEVDLDQAYEDRAILYLGNRDEGNWQATPLFRLDFEQATLVNGGSADLSDSLDNLALRVGMIDDVNFRVRQTREDNSKAVSRRFQLRELAGDPTLDVSLLDQEIAALLGPVVSTVTDASIQQNLFAPVDPSLALSWFQTGGALGLALVDQTVSQPFPVGELDSLTTGLNFVRPNSNFVAIASEGIVDALSVDKSVFQERVNDALLDLEYSEIVPKLIFDLRADSVSAVLGVPLEDLADVAIEVPVIEDLTHVQHDLTATGDLTMGSYLTRRLWLDFDVIGSAIPGDATINEAVLTLHVRPDSEIGGEKFGIIDNYWGVQQTGFDTQAFEVDVVGASTSATVGLDFILSSAGSIAFFPASDVFQIDVTDFAQRDANLLLSGELGIMIRLSASSTTLNSIEFYGTDAADSLQPRLDVRFTPPADFWE